MLIIIHIHGITRLEELSSASFTVFLHNNALWQMTIKCPLGERWGRVENKNLKAFRPRLDSPASGHGYNHTYNTKYMGNSSSALRFYKNMIRWSFWGDHHHGNLFCTLHENNSSKLTRVLLLLMLQKTLTTPWRQLDNSFSRRFAVGSKLGVSLFVVWFGTFTLTKNSTLGSVFILAIFWSISFINCDTNIEKISSGLPRDYA